jgi:hypothetical protein
MSVRRAARSRRSRKNTNRRPSRDPDDGRPRIRPTGEHLRYVLGSDYWEGAALPTVSPLGCRASTSPLRRPADLAVRTLPVAHLGSPDEPSPSDARFPLKTSAEIETVWRIMRAMIETKSSVRHQRFPEASRQRVAWAPNAIVVCDDEWEVVAWNAPEIEYSDSVSGGQRCHLAGRIREGRNSECSFNGGNKNGHFSRHTTAEPGLRIQVHTYTALEQSCLIRHDDRFSRRQEMTP